MEPDSIFLKGQSPWGTKKSMMTCGLWDFDFDTDPDTEEIKVIRNEYPVLYHPRILPSGIHTATSSPRFPLKDGGNDIDDNIFVYTNYSEFKKNEKYISFILSSPNTSFGDPHCNLLP